MRIFLSALVISLVSSFCFAQNDTTGINSPADTTIVQSAPDPMVAALAELRDLRGREGFISLKDSLLFVASSSKDYDALAQIHLSYVRHYTTIGTLAIRDELKKATEECKSFCASHEGFYNTYYSAWNAYITYLVNNHIFSEASQEIKKMQDEAIKNKLSQGIYSSYVALGNLNALEGIRDIAAEYYEKAIEYYEDNEEELKGLAFAAVFSNLSGCYIALERYSDAEQTLRKAMEKTNSDSFLVNLCLLYEKQEEWDRLYELLNSIDFGKSFTSATKDKFYASYARYYSHTRDFSKAVEYASLIEIPARYETLAAVYKKKGDFRNALTYKELSDSVKLASLIDLQKTQLAETDQLFDHNRIFQEEVRREQRRNLFIIAFLMIALVLFVLISYVIYRRRRKVAMILMKEHEKTLLADHQKSVFIKNMTHEMMTPLNHISGFSQLMVDETLDKDSLLEYAKIVDEGARHLSKIFDNISSVASKLDEFDTLSEVETVMPYDKKEGEL